MAGESAGGEGEGPARQVGGAWQPFRSLARGPIGFVAGKGGLASVHGTLARRAKALARGRQTLAPRDRALAPRARGFSARAPSFDSARQASFAADEASSSADQGSSWPDQASLAANQASLAARQTLGSPDQGTSTEISAPSAGAIAKARPPRPSRSAPRTDETPPSPCEPSPRPSRSAPGEVEPAPRQRKRAPRRARGVRAWWLEFLPPCCWSWLRMLHFRYVALPLTAILGRYDSLRFLVPRRIRAVFSSVGAGSGARVRRLQNGPVRSDRL